MHTPSPRTGTMNRSLLLLLVLCMLTLQGCAATMQAPQGTLEPPTYVAPVSHTPESHPPAPDAASDVVMDDPLENYNRHMYVFNAKLDRYAFIPVVNAYEAVIPKPVRTGIGNIFNNLSEPPRLVNCLLQGKFGKGGVVFGRFAINSTFGLLGLFDVASRWGLYPQDEDAGQTLGVWGFPSGPYVILPVLGPSNVRDTFGYAGDFGMRYAVYESIYAYTDNEMDWRLRYGVSVLEAVDLRSRIPFRYYESGTPFEYNWMRFLYMEKRKIDIER